VPGDARRPAQLGTIWVSEAGVGVLLASRASTAVSRSAARPLTGAQARQVRSLRAGGESISELVRTFGVSRATVYRALQQADWAKPSGTVVRSAAAG